MEPFLVVPELSQDTGREDHPETRLAEINISRRVPTKMLFHHFVQLRDLRVQRSDEPDLPDNNGRVGGLSGRGLTQARCSKHGE